jgi:hypothetical protein
MPGPVVVITLRDPRLYDPAQLRYALGVAHWMDRGRFLLLIEPPEENLEDPEENQA